MNAYIYESFDSVTVECHGNSMNQVIQVGSEEVGVVAVAVEEVDGQVGEVEDMAMVDMMSLTPWLCQATRLVLIIHNEEMPVNMDNVHSQFLPGI